MRSMRLLGSPGLLCAGLVTGGSVVLAQGSAFAASAPSCVSAQMVVTHGQAQGTARTTYIPLVFTNKGRACAIWGVPAVQPVTGAHHSAVGPTARNNSMGEMPVRHVVARGAAVSVDFGVVDTGNYTASSCVARSASGVIVSLGSFIHPTYVHLPITVCARRVSVTTKMIVPGVDGY